MYQIYHHGRPDVLEQEELPVVHHPNHNPSPPMTHSWTWRRQNSSALLLSAAFSERVDDAAAPSEPAGVAAVPPELGMSTAASLEAFVPTLPYPLKRRRRRLLSLPQFQWFLGTQPQTSRKYWSQSSRVRWSQSSCVWCQNCPLPITAKKVFPVSPAMAKRAVFAF